MVFSKTFANNRTDNSHPQEDRLLIGDGYYCVADGVTRDPLDGKSSARVPNETYPDPSPARVVADIFCDTFTRFADKDLQTAFEQANIEIKAYNRLHFPNPDYLVNSLAGCVAAGVVVKENHLDWCVIGDCGVAIFDRLGKLKFQSPNRLAAFEAYWSENATDWEDPKTRVIVRKLMNQPQDPRSYGALTGDEVAMGYLESGEEELDSGDLVVVYSDGFAPYLKIEGFFDALNNKDDHIVDQMFTSWSQDLANSDMELYGKERTLVSFLIE